MGFVEAIRTCFRKYATFSGRAARSEFWWFVLFVWLGSIVATIVWAVLFGPTVQDETTTEYDGGLLGGLFSLVVFLPMLAVTGRRLHDRDLRAWWMLLPYGIMVLSLAAIFGFQEMMMTGNAPIVVLALLPFGALVWLVVTLARSGTPGPNRFGPPPAQAPASLTTRGSDIPQVGRR